jgi:hypothetical protein
MKGAIQMLDLLRERKRWFDRKAGALAKPMLFAAVGATGMVVDLLGYFCCWAC